MSRWVSYVMVAVTASNLRKRTHTIPSAWVVDLNFNVVEVFQLKDALLGTGELERKKILGMNGATRDF